MSKEDRGASAASAKQWHYTRRVVGVRPKQSAVCEGDAKITLVSLMDETQAVRVVSFYGSVGPNTHIGVLCVLYFVRTRRSIHEYLCASVVFDDVPLCAGKGLRFVVGSLVSSTHA